MFSLVVIPFKLINVDDVKTKVSSYQNILQKTNYNYLQINEIQILIIFQYFQVIKIVKKYCKKHETANFYFTYQLYD